MSWRRGAVGLLLLTSILPSCQDVDHAFFAVHRLGNKVELLFNVCSGSRAPAVADVRVVSSHPTVRHQHRVLLWRIVPAEGRTAPLSSAVVGQVPPGFVEKTALAGRHFGPWLRVEVRTGSSKVTGVGPYDVRLPYNHRRVRTSSGITIPRRRLHRLGPGPLRSPSGLAGGGRHRRAHRPADWGGGGRRAVHRWGGPSSTARAGAGRHRPRPAGRRWR